MAEKNIDKFESLIKAKLDKYSNKTVYSEEGKVISVADGIALVSGLENVMLNEIVKFSNGSKGIALNLESNIVGVTILGKYDDIKENDIVKRTKTVMAVPVGDGLVGRVVNSIGEPIDDKGTIEYSKKSPIEKIAPGVISREPVNEPLYTGTIIIDSMFPIGKGQRELIIGDRQTGKTSIAINTIINQKGKNVKCVYVCIGQKNSSLAQIIRTLHDSGAMEYTTVVAATASASPIMMYIAPYSGITIAEE
jgi:F-type H+-transporting ATPase subunit alpha